MKWKEKPTTKYLSSSSSLHSLQRKAVVLPLCIGRWRGLSIALLLAALWLVGIPVGAKSMTTVSSQPNVLAAADTSMVAYTEKKTCAKIPSAYKNKIDSVLKENLPVIELNGNNSWSFTTDFVIKEMESDWGISKDNQLLFTWSIISKQLVGEHIYDGEDGDSNRLEEYKTAVRTARSCGQRYKDGIMPFIEKACAEYDRQSAEAKLVSFTNCINKYNDFINENNDVLDMTMVKEARNIISEYNQKIGEFKKRVENLATRLNSQNLSESELESIKNMAGQLCTDIDAQRTAMLKQRIVIVEKACVVVENKISEIQKKIAGIEDANIKPFADGAKEKINDVKKYIGKAKTNNNEDNLLSAEVYIVSAEARRQSAEARKQSAEARKQSAEAIKETMRIDSLWLKDMVRWYNARTTSLCQEELVKNAVKGIIMDCEKRGIDYRAIILKEVGDRRKLDEILKFYDIE